MELKECKIIYAEVIEKGEKYPTAIAIVIAPTQEQAETVIRKELKSCMPDLPEGEPLTEELCTILLPPQPTIVFLYTKEAGRIK